MHDMLVNAPCPTHRPQSFFLVAGRAVSTSSTEPNSTLHFPSSVSHRYVAHRPCRNPTRQLRGSREHVNLSTPTRRNRNLPIPLLGYPIHAYLVFQSLAPSPLGYTSRPPCSQWTALPSSMRHTRSCLHLLKLLSLADHHASSRTCICARRPADLDCGRSKVRFVFQVSSGGGEEGP